jgi:hypothetical protein
VEPSYLRRAPLHVAWTLSIVAACSSAQSPAPTIPVASSPAPASAPVAMEPEAPLPRADSPEVVREVMAARGADVRRCYTRELRNTPSLRGRMLVQFTVQPDGAVFGVRVQRDTIRSPRVRACVTHVIENLRFASGSAAPMRFRYPFVFAPNQDL